MLSLTLAPNFPLLHYSLLHQINIKLKSNQQLNMVHKVYLLRLLVLFLGFSYVLSSCSAVPATRSLKSYKENPTTAQDLLSLDAVNMIDGEELIGAGETDIEGRLLMESTDYPGTGANNHHDPKTPGRA